MYRKTMFALLVSLPFAATAASGDALRERGAVLFHAGQLEAAADVLEQAIESDPADAAAHYLLGQTYGRQAAAGSMFTMMRLADDVREQFERAVALAPDELEYRETLIQFYAQAPAMLGGGLDKAKAQAAEIAKRDPVRGQLARGLVLRLEDKQDEAIATYRAFLVLRPDDAPAGVELGMYLQELERWDEAIAQFRDIVQRDPNQMTAWYQLGRTTVLADRNHAEGEAAFKRYLEHAPSGDEPTSADAHWRLGMLYELMQRAADARRQYQDALKLDPKHSKAKAALRKLG